MCYNISQVLMTNDYKLAEGEPSGIIINCGALF